MQAAFVIVDSLEGSMTRYVMDPHGNHSKTHSAQGEPNTTFGADLIETFRKNPDSRFYVGPPIPIPGGNDSPGSPAAVAAPMALAA